MPNPVWPAELPQIVQLSGYQESPPDLVLRTQMDAGPAKVRRRFTSGVRPIKASLTLHENECQMLDNFFIQDCAGGALAFDWQSQRSPDASELVDESDLVTDSTFLLVARSMRFVKPPTYQPLGGELYEAMLDLEILP